jgi:sugar phosphate isomerase/epimerase
MIADDLTGGDPVRLGAVTFNLFNDSNVETIIQMLQTAGFEGVELRTTHAHGVEPSTGPAERKTVRKLFEQSSVKLVGYGTTCDFHSPDAAQRAAQVELGKQFVDLAVDTGAIGVKVRPNGLPEEVPVETTIANIAASLRELGDYALSRQIDIWLEVHGKASQEPKVIYDIMKSANHPGVWVCWNCNRPDITDGSIRANFELLRPWIRHCHIHDLTEDYPYRELFVLLRDADYRGYTLIEAPASCEPERFLKYYQALWTELSRG